MENNFNNTDDFITLLGINGEELQCNINNTMTINNIKKFIINNTTNDYLSNNDLNTDINNDCIRLYLGNNEIEDCDETLDFHNIQENSYLNFKYDIVEVDLKVNIYSGICSLRKYTIYVPSYYDVYSTVKKYLGYENICNDLLNMTIYDDKYTEIIIEKQKNFETIKNNTLNIIFVELEKNLKSWAINSTANALKNYLVPTNELNNTPFPQINGTAYFWHNWHMIIDCYILNIWSNILQIKYEQIPLCNLYELNNILYNDNDITNEFNKQCNSTYKININCILNIFEENENNNLLVSNFKNIYQQQCNNSQVNNIQTNNLLFIEFYNVMKEIIISNKQTKILNDSLFIHNIQYKLLKPWNFILCNDSYRFNGPLKFN